ncbi:MAG: tol-pal system-associated acyl-CoA thioesterase [Gammaproteobacteria bacterium]|nr:tol-pal system-associated acyl-CoA thioesterase [Gammaproteobacteria bacterium]
MTNEAFEWPVRVYYEDTDAQGVVYYANYFRFMERARTEWLRALGVDQVKMLHDDRRMFVVVKTQAEFVVPAKFNDELIVTAKLTNLTRASFDIEQNIYRDNQDGTLLLRGGVKAAILDADTHRPKRVSSSFFEGNE